MKSECIKTRNAPTAELVTISGLTNAEEAPYSASLPLLDCVAASHIGLVRENNEDIFHYDCERGILIVIDGIGGHASGEKAAKIALQALLSVLEQSSLNTAEKIRQAITLANKEIYLLAQAKPKWRGMGCVLTVAVVENESVTIGHVGDTRLYLLSDGSIKKITPDHSPVGELEDACVISEIEAMRHPKRNEVFRDVGTEKHLPDDEDFIEILQCVLQPKGALLLCSDGLSDLVTSAQMLDIATRFNGKPEKVVERLIASALEAGGKDNVTVVFATYAKANSEIQGNKNGVTTPKEINDKTISKIFRTRKKLLSKIASGRLTSFATGLLTASLILGLWLYYLPPSPPNPDVPLQMTPRVLLVDKEESKAYRTISDALAAASFHDTIVVSPGEYKENINLRNGVTLISRDLRRAIIRAPKQSEAGEFTAVLATNIRQARIVGFLIEGVESNPLDVGLKITGGEVEASDLEIKGARVAAVEIGGDASGTIRSNLLQNNAGIGIIIRDQAAPRLLHNLIRSNGQNARRRGIEILGAARPILLGNVSFDNGEDEIGGLLPHLTEVSRRENIIGKEVAEKPKPELRLNESLMREKR